ncbi:MAG: sulfatase-like hydrolase/transferase [Cyanobacteriota bacterium]
MFRYCIYQKTLLYLVESNIFPKKELYFNSEISLNKPVNKPIKLESKPDIILITLDSLRNDYAQKLLSINDGGFLNFSKNSYNFTNAYSHSSYTVSSISSLFTGKYLTSRFDTKDKSLVKILDNNSYVTYSLNVNSAPLLFEEFIINDKKYKSIFSEGFDVLDRTKSEKYNHSEFRSLFSSFINKRDKTKPFFAWVHFSNLHMIHPFVFFENFFSGDNFKKKYKSLLIESDENLEMFINIIKQNNLYDNSIIILTSDHGEGMKDHGSLFHVFGLYEEYVRVPLFIKFPKQKTFKIIEDKVSLIDVFPTILEYTDSENQYTDYDGLSLINLIENTKLKKKYTFLSFCLFKPIKRFENFSLYGSGYNNKKIIIETAIIDNTNSYKLIKNHIFGYEELYNLNDDPREQNNLIDDESKIAKYLRKELFKKISRAMVD